jgi:hypothetical protein
MQAVCLAFTVLFALNANAAALIIDIAAATAIVSTINIPRRLMIFFIGISLLLFLQVIVKIITCGSIVMYEYKNPTRK